VTCFALTALLYIFPKKKIPEKSWNRTVHKIFAMYFLRQEVVLYIESTAKFNAFGTGMGESAEVNHTEAERRDGLISIFVF